MQLPVGLAFIDYSSRTVGVGRYVQLSGDVDADLRTLREFYAEKRGLHPQQASAIAFRRAAGKEASR